MKRRQFLKNATIAAVGLPVAPVLAKPLPVVSVSDIIPSRHVHMVCSHD
jgi:hypothetical protein